MTDYRPSQTGSRSPGSRSDRTRPDRATQNTGWSARSRTDLALYVLMAAIATVLGALLIQIWLATNRTPALAAYNPVPTPIPYTPPTATPTPTVTPTPGPAVRAAERVALLQQSWGARDWKTATEHLQHIAALDSNYPGLQQAQCDTYLHWAQDLEKRCQIEQAYARYRQSSSYCPDPDVVSDRKDLALSYLSGRWRIDHQKWSQAAAILHTVYERDPAYAANCVEPLEREAMSPAVRALDVRSLLYTSYMVSSQELLGQGHVQEALRSATAALELAPDSPPAIKLLAQIRSQITPAPGPSGSAQESTVEDKRIEVSISRQRMYVWQGDTLIYDWICSTGGPGSGTATGRFQVQSKIPEAWASQWSLRMPYWLGIYNVGTLENGIHALPIRSNGTMLWAGYLGTPVSYGCIILSTENARTLYQWADMGTPVWIYY